MASFRYWFYDWSSGTLLDVLPLENTAMTWAVNAPGTLTGDLPLYADALSPARVLGCTKPIRTKVFVSRDDVLIWGGRIIEPRSYDSSTGRVTVNAEETVGYFKYRFLPTLQLYGYDQIAIAQSILGNLQGVAHGSANLTVVAPAGMSGILRDGVYSKGDFTDGLTAITDITEMEFGFEFGTQVTRDPTSGLPVETLILAYPRLGRIGAASPLVLEYNDQGAGNVENYQWPDGPGLFTETWADATTPDGIQLVASYQATSLLDNGYPLLEKRVDFSSAKPSTLATLQSYANKQGKISGQELTAATFTAKSAAGLSVGTWTLGDDVLVRITDQRRFPAGANGAPGYAGYMRISQVQLSPDTSGMEQYQFTCDNYWGLATTG